MGWTILWSICKVRCALSSKVNWMSLLGSLYTASPKHQSMGFNFDQKSETYTKAEVDALLSTIVSNQGLQNAIFSGLHTIRATQVSDLSARLDVLEAIPRLVVKLAPGATGQIVDEIHLQAASFGGTSYYPQSNILYIQTQGPADSEVY